MSMRQAKPAISQEKLRELFDYDSGVLRWRVHSKMTQCRSHGLPAMAPDSNPTQEGE